MSVEDALATSAVLSARRRHGRRVVLSLLTAASLAGCGLRVDHAQTVAQGLTPGDAAAMGANGASGATASASGAAGGAGAIGVGSASGAAGAASVPGRGAASPIAGTSPRAAGAAAAAAAGVPEGRGLTSKTITVGFQVSKDLQAGFAAVGANGSPPNESQIVDALVKWVNDTGGIAGRKLVALKHETDPTGGTWASQAQAVCADFTQDHKVFAVGSSPVGGSDALLNCLAPTGTPLIEQNLWLFDDQYYRQFPGMLYQPGRASPSRWAKAYVEGLDRTGFFKGATTKVGLLRFDAPVFARISNNVLKPTMARFGHRFDSEIAVREPAGISDFGGMAAEFNNAIVTMRGQGIDHVMFLENAGEMPFFFMQQADSQGYRPKYGLTSNDIPATLAGQESASQLNGATVVGWTPPNDVGYDKSSGPNPANDKCRQIMTKYGVTNQQGFYVQSLCDTVFFLRTVVPSIRSTAAASFAQAVAALGTSYDSPFTFRTRFSAGHYDGAAAYRAAGYVGSCSCFRYSGSSYPM